MNNSLSPPPPSNTLIWTSVTGSAASTNTVCKARFLSFLLFAIEPRLCPLVILFFLDCPHLENADHRARVKALFSSSLNQ